MFVFLRVWGRCVLRSVGEAAPERGGFPAAEPANPPGATSEHLPTRPAGCGRLAQDPMFDLEDLDPVTASYHEAGHVLMAHLLGGRVVGASIEPARTN